MKKLIHSASDFIIPIIDFFYPPFKKIMNQQTFRYAAAGGANALLGFILYAVSYKYILHEQELHLGFFAFKAHVAALFFSFCVCFPIGFFMARYVIFSDSNVRWGVQMVRYLMVWIFNLFLNYILLKVLVEQLHVYAIFAQIITTGVVIVVSYLAQRNFSFKVTNPIADDKDDVTL